MIGVDTNILVRFFVADDEEQFVAAKRLLDAFEGDDPLYVNAVVIVELVWALNKVYRLSMAEVRTALLSLCDSYNVVVEHRDVIEHAVARNGEVGADIADVVIAGLNRRAGVVRTMTFDKTAAKHIDGMDLHT